MNYYINLYDSEQQQKSGSARAQIRMNFNKEPSIGDIIGLEIPYDIRKKNYWLNHIPLSPWKVIYINEPELFSGYLGIIMGVCYSGPELIDMWKIMSKYGDKKRS